MTDVTTTAEVPPCLDEPIEGFELERKLGEGAFAVVYRARALSSSEVVALKVAHAPEPSLSESLRREASIMGAVGAPAVPKVWGGGTTGTGRTYVEMEFVEGPTLGQRLHEAGGRIRDPGEIVTLFGALLDALERVHEAGFVHADLKPDNVLIGGPLGVTLLDLGLSTVPNEVFTRTQDHLPAGTVEYMSPEQCTTGARVDHRSDVYALGVLLVELLTGQPPFVGAPEHVREAQRSHRVPALPLHAPIGRFVASCLAKDPHSRPDSVARVRQAWTEAVAAAGDTFVLAPRPRPVSLERPTPAANDGDGGRSRRRRETVGLIWFSTTEPVPAVRRFLRQRHGTLIRIEGAILGAAFAHEGRENPVRAALFAGQALVDRGQTRRVVLDAAEAAVRPRKDAPPRITGPKLRCRAEFEVEGGASGIVVTAAAKALMGDHDLAFVPTGELYRVDDGSGHDDTVPEPSTPLFGREAEVAAIEASVVRALAGKPTLCTIEGDRGVGKSHLAHALFSRLAAEHERARVIAVRAPEPLAGAPRRTTNRLLGRLLGLGSTLPHGSMALVSTALGSEFVEQFGLGLEIALDWVDAEDPRLEKLQAAPGAVRATASIALGEAIRRAAAHGALVLLVDDAHFADETLLSAIEYATRGEHDLPIWVGVLVRPVFTQVASRAGWGAGAGSHTRISLGPLHPKHASRLVRHLLAPASGVPQWAVESIVERTRSVPLLLRELVEGLKRDGFVRRLERGTGWYVATDALAEIPDLPLVEWLVTRELAQLPDELRQFAALAAMMGPEFSVAQLNAVTEAITGETGLAPSILDASVGVRRLVGSGVLESREGQFEFRHELLRQGICNLVPPAKRRRWNAVAYRCFDAEPGQDPVSREARLAHHAAGAGMSVAVVHHQLELARAAVARHGYLDAERHYAAALEHCADRSAARLELLHGLGLMRCRLGLYEAASEALGEALVQARAEGDRAREVDLLLDAATVWDWREDYSLSASLVEDAAVLAEDLSSPLVEARLILGRSRASFRQTSDNARTYALALEAFEKAEESGERGYETRVDALTIAAPICAFLGKPERSEQLFGVLLGSCREHNDALHLASAYNNRAVLWLSIGDPGRMLADLEQVLDISQRFGFSSLEAIALRNVAEVHFYRADFEACARLCERAISIGETISGGGQRVVVSQLLMARCAYLAGNEGEARSRLELIRELQGKNRSQGRSESELTPTDQALLQAMELAISGASPEAWAESLARSREDATQHDAVEVYELRGVAAWRAGDRETASEALRSAMALVEEINAPLIAERVRHHLLEVEAGTDRAANDDVPLSDAG